MQDVLTEKLTKYIDEKAKEYHVHLKSEVRKRYFTDKEIREIYLNQVYGVVMFAQEYLGLDDIIADRIYDEFKEKVVKGVDI